MYRVGLGECFLLSFSEQGHVSHVLIDCGVHRLGDLGLMRKVVDNIASECDQHLNIVVATHINQTNISGFATGAEKFKRFTIDEIWLPWMEDDGDAAAAKAKQRHLDLAETLSQHLQARGMMVEGTVGGNAIAALNSGIENSSALTLLKGRLNCSRVRYVAADDRFIGAGGIASLTVSILAPARNGRIAGQVNSSIGDRFFRLEQGDFPVERNRVLPFVDKWWARSAPECAVTEDDKELLSLLTENSVALSFTLSQACCNTSIVAHLNFGGKTLLFPGNLSGGAWDDLIASPQTRSLLQNLDVFKVPYFASCNAVPKTVLAALGEGVVTLISTHNRPWASIPDPGLLSRLADKTRLVLRSDSIPIFGLTNSVIDLENRPGVSVGPFWCDFEINL